MNSDTLTHSYEMHTWAFRACLMCGRPLDVPGDEMSRDCGGDCWGCMVEHCPDDPDVIAWVRRS